MRPRDNLVQLFFICAFASALFSSSFVFGKSSDANIQVFTMMEGRNTSDAITPAEAFLIKPNIGANATIECHIIGNDTVKLDTIKTVFIVTGIDTISKSNTINEIGSKGRVIKFIQKWKYDNLGLENVDLVSGIYKVRYDLYYTSNGQDLVLEGSPFYIKFDGNPLLSVMGIASTITVVSAGVSILGALSAVKGSINSEFRKSVSETKVSPSAKLRGFYRGKSYSLAQGEISSILYGYASKMWNRENCPQCSEEWPDEDDQCPSCQLTSEEARELYSTSIVEKVVTSMKEVVDSVSGLTLKGIADQIGEDEMPTASIISMFTFSGLTMIQPRVSLSLGAKERKLLFTSIRTTLSALFWIQACGFGVVSLAAMIVAIISGFIIPVVINFIRRKEIRKKIRSFWDSQHQIPYNASRNSTEIFPIFDQ